MGDPIRVVMLKAMAEEMRSKNLLAQCRESGRVLLDGLQELEVTFGSIPNIDIVSSVHTLLPPPGAISLSDAQCQGQRNVLCL